MGERKVLNKYFSPDFDPSKIPRKKLDYDAPMEIRTMLPFNMCCLTCGHYMYRGKKFIAKKETAKGEEYLGRIKVFRFYIKCEACRAQITYKTDPKNTDYACESGASRNFETWRNTGNDDNKELVEDPNAEDNLDTLEALEQRTLESKREMDTLDALEEIKAANQARSTLTSDDVIQKLRGDVQINEEDAKRVAEEEAEKEASRVFEAKRHFVKRIDDSKSDSTSKEAVASKEKSKPAEVSELGNVKLVRVKRKRPVTDTPTIAKVVVPNSTAVGLLGGYGSDSSNDSD